MNSHTALPAHDIIAAIERANAGRAADLLAMKYQKMAQSPFIFLRGACDLFYDTLPDTLPNLALLRDAPLAWCCGDLHFENFGSYKADNRQVYFDINDYDEAALAPATWDMLRLLTSILCGADALMATPAQARSVSRACLDGWRSALAAGKPLWVERETSNGLVHELLSKLQGRKRAEFLDKRTDLAEKKHLRSLTIDGVKALPASSEQRVAVTRCIDAFASTQPDPAFFNVLDVARRIAGTGSLGLQRFVVLVEGKGSPDGNYLLDVKQAKPSAMANRLALLGVKQPHWQNHASRVVAIGQRMQAVDHAFLHEAMLGEVPCILKELQPSEDRVAIAQWGNKLDRLSDVVATMGNNLAWDQLRASGRSGSANADALIAYARRDDWVADMHKGAEAMAKATHDQWHTFTAWRAAQA